MFDKDKCHFPNHLSHTYAVVASSNLKIWLTDLERSGHKATDSGDEGSKAKLRHLHIPRRLSNSNQVVYEQSHTAGMSLLRM